MRAIGRVSLGLMAGWLAVAALGQEAAPQAKAKKKRAANPAYAAVEDAAGLPRVLLLGDSISIGYTVPVREALAGQANVHRPPTNCGPTTRGVESLEAWLGEGKWDVIHFNFGLHDLKYVDEQGQNAPAEKGRHQVSLADYERNLETMVARMKRTGAKLIFATTTPVPAGTGIRVAGEEAKYNQVARRVMERHGVAVNDLCAFAQERLAEIQLPANVHFSPAGSKKLAEQVAASIRAALAKQ